MSSSETPDDLFAGASVAPPALDMVVVEDLAEYECMAEDECQSMNSQVSICFVPYSVYPLICLSQGSSYASAVVDTLLDWGGYPPPTLTDNSMLLDDDVNPNNRYWNAYNRRRAKIRNAGYTYSVHRCDRLDPDDLLDVYKTLHGCLEELSVGEVLIGEIHPSGYDSDESLPDTSPHMDRWDVSSVSPDYNFTIQNCGRLSARDVLDVHESLHACISAFSDDA